MQLSGIDIFDLFFRFAAAGQISILILIYLLKAPSYRVYTASVLSFCFICYLLLTAPIEDQHYGALRGILLFFTEFIPYLLWLLAALLLKDHFNPSKWPIPVYALLLAVVLWFGYFFGYLQGRGSFHQLNHYLQLLPLIHIVYMSLRDLTDDLVATRRRHRVLLLLLANMYFLFIMFVEVAFPWAKALVYFSLSNSGIVFFLSSLLAWLLISGVLAEPPANNSKQKVKDKDDSNPLPAMFRLPQQKLTTLMEKEFYKTPQLTIAILAKEVDLPEHQLRELINKHFGFRNFSEYLNSFRIPAACAQLRDLEQVRTPILTIALELGYGSVATFNRAFKQSTTQTPKEYRDHFQK